MLMDIIKARHSIRKYTDEQISREDMEKVMEAGNFAPNAGGGQRSILIGIHNKEMTTEIGIMNLSSLTAVTSPALTFQRNNPALLMIQPLKMVFTERRVSWLFSGRMDFRFVKRTLFAALKIWFYRQQSLALRPALFPADLKHF